MRKKKNSDFYLFAIRCTKEGSTGQRKLIANKPYYFISGIRIIGDMIYIDNIERLSENNLYKQFDLSINVNISAIVGENGAGKSTIVEYVIRLLNNFSTALFGEDYITENSDHLHFIDGIYGQLFYMLSGKPYSLHIEGNVIKVQEYSQSINEKNLYIPSDFQYITNKGYKGKYRTEKIKPALKYASNNDKLNVILGNFFYTLVSNYSLYAYNTADYLSENTTEKLEHIIRKSRGESVTEENSSWLHGLFHKNDGYQIPLVLMPRRKRGVIDINVENELSKERFLHMIFWNKTYRTINGHLHVSHISCKCKKYDIKFFKKRTHMSCNKKGYEILYDTILRGWSEVLNYDLTKAKYKTFYELAIEYLVYKTIKISYKYPQYNSFYDKNKRAFSCYDLTLLEDLIKNLSNDKSHITVKLRRTLAYLRYRTYDFIQELNFDIDIDDASQRVLAGLEYLEKDSFINSPDDLLPPPFWSVEICLQNRDGVCVNFETLSSGEKQQVYSISSILYQLKNIDSVAHDLTFKRITYHRVLLILEEIELYYHPELQKKLVINLLDGIRQISTRYIEAINIIFVTHSPFVLSDISSDNILLLSKDNSKVNKEIQTFGANIHDIMDTGFFMPVGAMGAYAEWLLKRLVVVMEQYKNPKSYDFISNISDDDDLDAYDFLRCFYNNCYFNKSFFEKMYSQDWVYKSIMQFDEPILQQSLLNQYYIIFNDKSARKRELEEKIAKFQEELNQLNED